MKKHVTEIDKKTLIDLLPVFGIESQISIIDNEQTYDNSDSGWTESFYIEENIIDLDKLLILCDTVSCNRKNPIRKQIDWEDFCMFWELLQNIQKQREFGYPMTNIEYIYKKGLQLNLPIKYQRASVELGFYPDINYYVITGKSEIGEMMLYQEDEYYFLEFVFEIQYFRAERFIKEKIIENTHWHPYGYQMALEDMIAFMTNDKEYFRRKGLGLL